MPKSAERISRRKALAIGAGAAAAGVIGAPILVLAKSATTSDQTSSWWTSSSVNLATAGYEEWKSYVGKNFTLRSEVGDAKVGLQSVDLLPSSGDRPEDVSRDQAFKLVFAKPTRVPACDRIYALRDPTGKEFGVYFSPPGTKLLAVFN